MTNCFPHKQLDIQYLFGPLFLHGKVVRNKSSNIFTLYSQYIKIMHFFSKWCLDNMETTLFKFCFRESLHEKTKTPLTQFSRFAHEIIWSKVMSREKALTLGYERPTDTEVSVNSLAQCCLNTASHFVMPVYKSVRECRYRSIRKLETRHVNLSLPRCARSALNSRAGSLMTMKTCLHSLPSYWSQSNHLASNCKLSGQYFLRACKIRITKNYGLKIPTNLPYEW